MSEREMLERAAAAAGYVIVRWAQHNYPIVRDGDREFGWNPRVFDSDALRLAVRKRFHVNIFSASNAEGIDTPGFVEIWAGDCDPIHTEYVNGSDYEAATRLAITRAAAALAPTAQGE